MRVTSEEVHWLMRSQVGKVYEVRVGGGSFYSLWIPLISHKWMTYTFQDQADDTLNPKDDRNKTHGIIKSDIRFVKPLIFPSPLSGRTTHNPPDSQWLKASNVSHSAANQKVLMWSYSWGFYVISVSHRCFFHFRRTMITRYFQDINNRLRWWNAYRNLTALRLVSNIDDLSQYYSRRVTAKT